MSWRPVRRAVTALAGLFVIIIAAGLAILHLPALNDARSRVAADLLSSYLGEPVDVTGDVDVTLGQTIDVSVQGVRPTGATPERPRATAPVGAVRMSFSLAAALRARLDLKALNLSGIRFVIDVAAAEPVPGSLGQRVSSAVDGVLLSPLLRNLKLEDVRILRVNDPAGWNGTLHFESVTLLETAGRDAVSVDAKGSLGGRAFSLAGSLPDLTSAWPSEHGDNLSMNLSMEGIEAVLKGRVTRGTDGSSLAARLDVTSPSLGDIQDLLGLKRVVEGTGALELALDGALATLGMEAVKLRIKTAAGRVYDFDGKVADIWAVHGVDIRFDAALDPSGAARVTSRFDMAPRSINGRLSSREDGFEINEVNIETGLASVELEEIGPIRIGKIARDDNGFLRLEEIRLVQGDPKAPVLDLTGSLNDALEWRGFSVKGSFRLGMAGLLTGRRDATGVGTLSGKAGVSDASGRLRLETLNATLQGTDLMSLSLRLADTGRSRDQIVLEFNVPDLVALASALGQTATAGTRIAFDGAIDAADDAVTVRGSARIDQTDLESRLRIAAPKGVPEITGKIESRDLHLGSLAAARDVAEVFSGAKSGAVRLRKDVQVDTRVSLDISADAVEGGGQTAGGLKARVVYAKSRLRLSPLALGYLGGRIDSDVDATLATSPPALTLKAAARGLSLEQVFKRLGTKPAASGSLDLDVAVTAKGDDIHALLASMSGEVSGAVRGGSLADRTINLAGQNLIVWMLTPSADGSAPLECLRAGFDFKTGLGTARPLVLETEKVQVVGGGTLNLRDNTVDFVLHPRAKRNDLVGSVGPVRVRGPLSKPRITLADGALAAKVVGDTIGLPLHILGALHDGGRKLSPEHKPCFVVPSKQ